jgi:hypothetical protein
MQKLLIPALCFALAIAGISCAAHIQATNLNVHDPMNGFVVQANSINADIDSPTLDNDHETRMNEDPDWKVKDK